MVIFAEIANKLTGAVKGGTCPSVESENLTNTVQKLVNCTRYEVS